ncbi:nucleotide-binding universal stress UspA family protein [Desulfosalsimonas propionicica]|uniref:Nucleotide-binding universal stress UspA family protein n=1 Tax=Desulfosalsimonas propionicica TaxID=332175 RepID=A0A7W0HLD7_9BACT|nr:universal stress protein [Desulfosalsimonas propionicica]MBA2882229.1 nucleotide-binding universal stress UspA family protein [Desulfosalsimonas propionicica]
MNPEGKLYNKNILIAIDESENSRRAVSYVGYFLGGLPGFTATILHVVPEPEEDYFPSSAEKEKWLLQHQKKIDALLDSSRQHLIEQGFAPEAVRMRSTRRYCPSMAECILSERDETAYSTLVVGRQGISQSEEFLFGSISSKIVQHARNCTVWVVE